MTETLLKLNENNIPRRSVVIQKSTPPLLTERGEETARRKHAAYGSAMETELALQRNICGQAVCARASYAIEVAACQTTLKHGWSTVPSIANRNQQVSNIPTLNDGAN